MQWQTIRDARAKTDGSGELAVGTAECRDKRASCTLMFMAGIRSPV
jgi:hypothetical protein